MSKTNLPFPAVVGVSANLKIPGELAVSALFLMPFSPITKLTVILPSVSGKKL